MRVFKIIKNTTSEGPGKRFCIWVQGCSRNCKGCYAQNTHDFSKGTEYDIKDIFSMINSETDIEGVTFLGGEPFEQAQELSLLAEMIKKKNLSIVCFTGFKIEDLKAKNNCSINKLLNNIDLLIDGEFDESKYDLSRPLVGSSNQRFIFLTSRYNQRDISKYHNKIEIRINPNGKTEINGMGDFKKFEKVFGLQPEKNIVN